MDLEAHLPAVLVYPVESSRLFVLSVQLVRLIVRGSLLSGVLLRWNSILFQGTFRFLERLVLRTRLFSTARVL